MHLAAKFWNFTVSTMMLIIDSLLVVCCHLRNALVALLCWDSVMDSWWVGALTSVYWWLPIWCTSEAKHMMFGKAGNFTCLWLCSMFLCLQRTGCCQSHVKLSQYGVLCLVVVVADVVVALDVFAVLVSFVLLAVVAADVVRAVVAVDVAADVVANVPAYSCCGWKLVSVSFRWFFSLLRINYIYTYIYICVFCVRSCCSVSSTRSFCC